MMEMLLYQAFAGELNNQGQATNIVHAKASHCSNHWRKVLGFLKQVAKCHPV
jgi:hypothetical protein